MSKTILFIDDDQVLQALVVHLLSKHLKDYTVLCASDTQQGLADARKHRPEVIVLDIMLQNENGWEAAEALKKNDETRHIPIIVASGAGSPFNGLPFIDPTLIAKYIRKPYNIDELVAALRDTIDITG